MFRLPDFHILELVNGTVLLENVVRTDEDDVLFLEVAIRSSLVEEAAFGGFLRLGLLQIKNFDSEDCLEKGLRNALVAEHQCEHEAVRDGQIFERDVVWLHDVPLCGLGLSARFVVFSSPALSPNLISCSFFVF